MSATYQWVSSANYNWRDSQIKIELERSAFVKWLLDVFLFFI